MTILVVDDEKDMQPLFEQRFREEIREKQAVLLFATSGEEALALVRSRREPPLLVLSDINMPGMTGLELLQQIQHAGQQPPPVVMMITAYGDTETCRRALQLGAADYFTKPLDFALIKQRIKNWN